MSASAEPQGERVGRPTPMRCPCCELKVAKCKCRQEPVLPQGVFCRACDTWWPWGVMAEDGRNGKREVEGADGK